jgi:hypothetical protein
VGVVAIIRTVATRVGWVAVALLVAFGTAGIVATMNHMPGTPGRPELTWAGDAAMRPALDAATDDLQALSDQVDQLGTTARLALSQVVAGDADLLQETITAGTLRLGGVEGLSRDLEASLGEVPHAGPDWALYVSADLRRRYDELAATSGLTAGLEDDWASFTGRSLAASHLSTLLARHDEETGAAARLGSDGRYRDALDQLSTSDATLAQARDLRDDLAGSTDVATLTAWLDRNAEYDAALRELYAALIKSDARVTAEVRRAFDREQRARAQLPGDTRALVVIMADIAQGGLNQAVIAIEEARGSLGEALEVQLELRDGPVVDLPG